MKCNETLLALGIDFLSAGKDFEVDVVEIERAMTGASFFPRILFRFRGMGISALAYSVPEDQAPRLIQQLLSLGIPLEPRE